MITWRVDLRAMRDRRAMDEVKEAMRNMGMRSSPRPVDELGRPLEPELPTDLTSLNDVKLGRLHGQFAAMARWAQLRMAIRGREAATLRRAEKIMRAKTRLAQEGTRDERADLTETNPAVQRATYDLSVAESVEVLTQAVFDGYIIGRDACSREMSRRMGLERDRRGV